MRRTIRFPCLLLSLNGIVPNQASIINEVGAGRSRSLVMPQPRDAFQRRGLVGLLVDLGAAWMQRPLQSRGGATLTMPKVLCAAGIRGSALSMGDVGSHCWS